MDDSQVSINAIDASAATRKRRSSILKSQRPQRTPLSELEFQVATPTDTTKSRRVSFSRRTGVAEFITNDATTTWKNFYEEHNKSLESSGNESAANAPRQIIEHIGKREFDHQFEEIELVDLEGTLQTNPRQEFQKYPSGVNVTQELAALEFTADRKYSVPQQNFELSNITDHQSKIFRDELSVPLMGEMSSQINVNFSVMQPISSDGKCDDLDEIQKDLERLKPGIICQGPTGRDFSEYIEVDFNMTSVGIRYEESDMSITDIIQGPKVQEVSKSNTSNKENNRHLTIDFNDNKENIVVNPYVTLKESKNFAINEASDKVLVFDGKKLTTQSVKETLSDTGNNSPILRKTLFPNIAVDASQQKKTIILNLNDDLPNFVETGVLPTNSKPFDESRICDSKNSRNFSDISMTKPVNNRIEIPKRKTIVFDDDMGDGIPAKLIINKDQQCETTVYETEIDNISFTQAIPTNIIDAGKASEKRKTIIYQDDEVSFTRALPANLILNNKSEVVGSDNVYCNNVEDLSITQAIPSKIIPFNKTQIFSNENNLNNVSITEAIPNNAIISDKICSFPDKSVNYVNNIDITAAVPDNIMSVNPSSEKRKTILYDNDSYNMSITQAVPNNIPIINMNKEEYNKSVCKQEKNIQDYVENKLLLNSDKLMSNDNKENSNSVSAVSNKRKTIVYENDEDKSFTQANNVIQELSKIEKRNTITESLDISITRALPSNLLIMGNKNKKPLSITIENERISTTLSDTKQGITINSDQVDENITTHDEKHKDKPMDNSTYDINLNTKTNPIPSEMLNIHDQMLFKSKTDMKTEFDLNQDNLLANNKLVNVKQDIVVYQVDANISKPKFQEKNEAELKVSKFDDVAIIEKESKIDAMTTYDCPNSTLVKENNCDIKSIEQETIECDNVDEKLSTLIDKSISIQSNPKPKKSILNELLDMSSESIEVPSKNITYAETNHHSSLKKNHDTTPVDSKLDSEVNSKESFLLITNDTDSDDENNKLRSNKIENICNEEVDEIAIQAPMLKYEETAIVHDLDDKLAALKSTAIETKSADSEYKSMHLDAEHNNRESDKSLTKDQLDYSKGLKSFRNADDTQELLEILSGFTDEAADEAPKEEKHKPPIEIKGHIAIENKTEVIESKRLSFATNRHSIVISREDLLNNISMAQAALRQSQFEMDDSENIEDLSASFEAIEAIQSPEKSVRMSGGAVRTLQFEDESFTDTNLQQEAKLTPLKKTAFGETSYMMDGKAKVIPTYLKDVSDGIKALMHDLVKPAADDLPFEGYSLDKNENNAPSTCSTQIQTNLMTTSQIDIADVELRSNPESDCNLKEKDSLVTEMAVMGNTTVPHVLKSALKPLINTSMDVIEETVSEKQPVRMSPQQTVPGSVLVFDHLNPLNNILLSATGFTDVHKYNPARPIESSNCQLESLSQNTDTKYKNEITAQYSVESRMNKQNTQLQSGDAHSEKANDSQSVMSSISKPLSMDKSTDGLMTDVKCTEANTIITMKGNKELLEASSSLTLVDDALAKSTFDVNIEAHKTEKNIRKSSQKSPVRVIYKLVHQDGVLRTVDSESIDEESEDMQETSTVTRKRSYSPQKIKECELSLPNIEVTPKPVSKMQKISNSPIVKKILRRKDRDVSSDNLETDSDLENVTTVKPKYSPEKRKSKSKSPKDNDKTMTVQQLMVEYHMDTNLDENTFNEKIRHALKEGTSMTIDSETISPSLEDLKSVDTVTSFANKGATEVDTKSEGIESQDVSTVGSKVSRVDWQPDLVTELSSKNLMEECESSTNVVAKINTLKFMGSRECEWEWSGGDAWSFKLMRTRLRLSVRLAHLHYNAPRTRVCADTPLLAVTVDTINAEEKDPLAALCVRLANESMRYECSRGGGCARAGEVPALLRRCAAVARVALRWARTMRDAWLRLAYSVTPDGILTLKVANVPLRSVWEVVLRVELVVEDAREGAWPCAGDVSVRAVLADPVPDARVRRLTATVPRDWGHVPRTLWKVFRYLKNKKGDDEIFAL